MNGVVRRAAARSLFLATGCMLPACQSYHAFQPTVAPSPLAGPAIVKSTTVAHSAGEIAMPAPMGSTSTVVGTVVADGDCSSCNDCGSRSCRGCNIKQKMKDFDWEQLRTDHCWPEQYNYESRRRVNQPLHDQIAAGHATVQTLHDFHFENEAPEKRGVLNECGKARIRYLARRRPYVVPSIFVQTTFDPAVDQARQVAVREYAASVCGEPIGWQVAMVNTQPNGLIGPEAAGSINKMIGPREGQIVPLPQYEQILKNTFYQGSGGGQQASGAGGS